MWAENTWFRNKTNEKQDLRTVRDTALVDIVRLIEAVEGETKGKKSNESFVLHSRRINPGFMGSRISLFYKK